MGWLDDLHGCVGYFNYPANATCASRQSRFALPTSETLANGIRPRCLNGRLQFFDGRAPGDGRKQTTILLVTVANQVSGPALSSSPRMRSAPHRWFSLLICLMRSMVSWGIRGFRFLFRDLRRQ